ncbi:MAG: CPBP family intramembrane metalloprotease [Puniceicoccales bacterium]|jgi:membrane protease YdiL (CAAX protease family)|nr:CPBP family intramembrane metalloprotease [Puniceicoccales bacterium]
MSESPLNILATVAIAIVVGRWWWSDFANARKGVSAPNALAGAVPCARGFVMLAAAGGVALTVLETLGEWALGVSEEQKKITVLFLAAMLAAAFLEELIFRGYIVIAGKGRRVLAGSVVGASLVFALAHDFLWKYEAGDFSFQFTTKGWFSFGCVFVASLCFYVLRFHPRNAARSLLPCIAAHGARNLAVFFIKLAQGHVTGWF